MQNNKRMESNGCTKSPKLQFGNEPGLMVCCDLKDVCYGMCGYSKENCDIEFDKCQKRVCESEEHKHSKECERAAHMHNLSSKFFDKEEYNAKQNAYCQCVKKTEVTDKWFVILKDFYKTYAPKKFFKIQEDWDDYCYNLGTEDAPYYPKIMTLYYKVHINYPEAILQLREGSRANDDL